MTGTLQLLRLQLRRDRLRLLLWIVGLSAAGFYFAIAIKVVTPTQKELDTFAGFFISPMSRFIVGPAYGMETPTHATFYAAGYLLFLYILCALFGAFTMIRSTRGDEDSGRMELVRSLPVGRWAPITATALIVLGSSIVVGAMDAAGALVAGYATDGAVLVGACAMLAIWLFAAVGALTAQLAATAGSAKGLAGAVLAACYLARGPGDMAEAGGTAASWISPLGWLQQTAPFVQNRWWPLLLVLALTAVLAVAALALQSRRDLGASLLHSGHGRSHARGPLLSPLGLAARITRRRVTGWAIAIALTASMYGLFSQEMVNSTGALPPQFQALFPGDSMLLGYIAFIARFMAVFIAAASLSVLLAQRGEETSGRFGYLLSRPVSRTRTLQAHVFMAFLAALLLTALAALALAATAAFSLTSGKSDAFRLSLEAGFQQWAPGFALIGITTALLGWTPRLAAPVGWALIGYGAVMTTFGQLLKLPDWLQNLNVFKRLAEMPVESFDLTPFLVLVGIGVLGIMIGLLGVRRRTINS